MRLSFDSPGLILFPSILPPAPASTLKYLGINALDNGGYSTIEQPWINRLKCCGSNYNQFGVPWITKNASGTDTVEELALYPYLDSDGYPTTLAVPGATFTYLETWMDTNQTVKTPYPPGATVRSFDGAFRFQFQGKCTLTLSGPFTVTNLSSQTAGCTASGNTITSTNAWGVVNTVTFNLADGSDLWLQIRQLPDSANYFKSASMVEQQYASLYDAGHICHPVWINAVTNYGAGGYSRLRCMGGFKTNNQEIQIDFTTAFAGGETSGTISHVYFGENAPYTSWPFPSGTKKVLFANGQVITCTFTANSTAVTFGTPISGAIATTGDGANSPWAMAVCTVKDGWSGRPLLSNLTWDGPGGRPIEAMIQVCNEIDVDPWVNIPTGDHVIDSTYSTNVAKMCRDGTGAVLTGSNLTTFTGAVNVVHGELGNETWNFSVPYRRGLLMLAMMSVTDGLYAANGNSELYGCQEEYGKQVAGVADAFVSVYGSDYGTKAMVGLMDQCAHGQGTNLMVNAMNTPHWTLVAWQHGIKFIGWAPYAGPASIGTNSADVAAIIGCNNPLGELFSLAYTNVGAITGRTYSISTSGWARNPEIALIISAIATQPWGNLPKHCYEGGIDNHNRLGSTDANYTNWKQLLTNFARDERASYIYCDPQNLLSPNLGYCDWLASLGVTFNQLGLFHPTPMVADWAGFNSLEIITQMAGIPPNSNAPKWEGQMRYIEGTRVSTAIPIGMQAFPDWLRSVRNLRMEVNGIPVEMLTPATVVAPAGPAYPRTAAIAIGGDQAYGSTTGAWSGLASGHQISTGGMFPDSGYVNPVQMLGRYDAIIIGGQWEGWDNSNSRFRYNLVDAIKTITNVGSFSPTLVFQYEILEDPDTTLSNLPYPSWNNACSANSWYLYTGTNQTGSPAAETADSATGVSSNWAFAYPNAVGSTPADTAFTPGRVTAPDGTLEGPTEWAADYFVNLSFSCQTAITTTVSGAIPASALSDSRWSFNTGSKAPNLDGIFLDNCFSAPRITGCYNLTSSATGTSSNNNASSTYADPECAYMLRGTYHFMTRFQHEMSKAYPTRTYYNICNMAGWDNSVFFGNFPTASAGLKNTMHGGVMEAAWGKSFSLSATSAGWAGEMQAYRTLMDFCLAPKLILIDGSPASATDWQGMRYQLSSALMDNGYCVIDSGVSGSEYDISKYVWPDEFGGNPTTNIAKGWLGYPKGARPTAAAVSGVWIRDFDNGVVLCNPKGNLAQTITSTQINTYFGTSYNLQFIKGVQNTTLNSGLSMSSVSLADGDGVLLVKSQGQPFDFYISTTGSDTNAGTLGSPWAITAINSKQATYAGKRLGVLPGTYDVSGLMGTNEAVAALTIAGGSSNSSRTYIGSSNSSGFYQRGTATLDAKGSTGFYGGSNSNQSPIMAGRSGTNFWTVDGLRFTGFSMWAFHVGNSPSGGVCPDSWTIQYCEFTGGNDQSNTTSSGVNCGIIIVYGSTNGLVQQNWSHDNVGSTDTQHWSFVYQWGLGNNATANNKYLNNTIVKSGNFHGKEATQYNTEIAYNYIDMTGTLTTSEYCGSAIEGFMADAASAAATLTSWHHNVILSNSMALSFDNDNPTHSYVDSPLQVYNNTVVVIGNTVSGFVNGGYTGTGVAGNVSYYNNLYWDSGQPKSAYGYFLTNVNSFNVCDYNCYGTWTGGGIFNTVPAGANTSAGLTAYSSLSAWATAIGGKEAHSKMNTTNPFSPPVGATYADQYQIGTNPVAYQQGRVGGVSTGAVTNIGAWDGSGRPGASWVT